VGHGVLTMSWIRNSPFDRHEDPVKHMLELLSEEAYRAGTPFSDSEKKMLVSQASRRQPLPEDLKQKAKALIEEILKEEQISEPENPKNFGNSLEWAGDGQYPNIVALTEDVVCDRADAPARLHGRRWVKDRIQLLGCAFLFVLFMMLISFACNTLFFHGK
jgi:hypothetical protein